MLRWGRRSRIRWSHRPPSSSSSTQVSPENFTIVIKKTKNAAKSFIFWPSDEHHGGKARRLSWMQSQAGDDAEGAYFYSLFGNSRIVFSLQFDEGSILLHAPGGCHQLLYCASCLQSRLPGGIHFQALFFFFVFFIFYFLLLLFVFFISSLSFLLQGVTTFFWVNLLCYLKARTNLYTTHIEVTEL